jgi:hypothetical protein
VLSVSQSVFSTSAAHAAAKVYSRPAGFEALSEDGKHYFAVSELDGQIGNGGFGHYFYNASADHYDYAIAGLLRLRANNSLEYLEAAKRVVFGQKKVPKEIEQRHRRLDALRQGWFLDVLDTAHYAGSDALRDKLEQFAIETGLINGG